MTVRFPRVHSLEEAAKNLLPNTGVLGQRLAGQHAVDSTPCVALMTGDFLSEICFESNVQE